MNSPHDRRTFIKSAAALTALAAWPISCATTRPTQLISAPRKKKPATIRGAFFYPRAEDVLAGRAEDGWSRHQWFTWPGNQFAPEEQQAKFTGRVQTIAAGLDLRLDIEEEPLATDAAIRAFINSLQESKPDALLLFNFWNSFSPKLRPILENFSGPIILYHPVGANHQLPPEYFRTAPRVQYIHSIENWAALERGLRSVHAQTRMAQSKLLRVSGQAAQETDSTESFFKTRIHSLPASHFNSLFDDTELTTPMEATARMVRNQARNVREISHRALLDAVRAHAAVQKLMEQHEADAITIDCLFLKHRKPCLSFAWNNGDLVPCGCENDLNATLTLMLGANLFGRGGFQHNPEFDTEQNLYFASHCTCTTKLHGPNAKGAPYELRPFFHQEPKTLALDVQWPAGQAVTLFKFRSGENVVDAWRGEVISSPACPPTGGCATRVLVKIDGVEDVCSVYSGPHPVLYCGDFAGQARTFARLYGLGVRS
jgi:hypothetical protein